MNKNSQTKEITDPLKVFDSFSVFVEPISYQRIFHLHGFSVVHNTTFGKILEIQPHLITARRAKDCCRSPLLVAFKIPDIYFPPPVLFYPLKPIKIRAEDSICTKTPLGRGVTGKPFPDTEKTEK